MEKKNMLILTVVLVGVAIGLYVVYKQQKPAPPAAAATATPATPAATTT